MASSPMEVNNRFWRKIGELTTTSSAEVVLPDLDTISEVLLLFPYRFDNVSQPILIGTSTIVPVSVLKDVSSGSTIRVQYETRVVSDARAYHVVKYTASTNGLTLADANINGPTQIFVR